MAGQNVRFIREKFLIIRWSLGKYDNPGLIEEHFKNESVEKQLELEALFDGWERIRKRNRTSPKTKIFETLLNFLLPTDMIATNNAFVNAEAYLQANPFEFLSMLGNEIAERFLKDYSDKEEVAHIQSFNGHNSRSIKSQEFMQYTNRFDISNHAMFLVDLSSHNVNPQKEWLKNGVVDQKYMYISRDSVDNWNELIYAELYKYYVHCEDALKLRLNSESWNNILDTRNIESVVILGAGASKKELKILNSIMQNNRHTQDNKLKFFVFDSSFYMLYDSIINLKKTARVSHFENSVEFIPCCADFENIKHYRKAFHEKIGSNTVFFILGLTINNVEEQVILSSLKSVAKEGDVLIIGTEFGDVNSQEFKNYLDDTYNRPETINLAVSTIREMLDKDADFGKENNIPYVDYSSKDERCKLVQVRFPKTADLPKPLVSEAASTIAVVFETKKAIGHALGEARELILVTSRRYDESEFNNLMIKHKFFPADSGMPCNMPATHKISEYKNLMFEFLMSKGTSAIRTN